MYVTVIYVRPSEIISSLADVPIVAILTAGSVPIGALDLLMSPRRFIPMPTDLCVLGIWIAIVLMLYPLCWWFARVKQRYRSAWLSYL